jgi:hypothetical protein
MISTVGVSWLLRTRVHDMEEVEFAYPDTYIPRYLATYLHVSRTSINPSIHQSMQPNHENQNLFPRSLQEPEGKTECTRFIKLK